MNAISINYYRNVKRTNILAHSTHKVAGECYVRFGVAVAAAADDILFIFIAHTRRLNGIRHACLIHQDIVAEEERETERECRTTIENDVINRFRHKAALHAWNISIFGWISKRALFLAAEFSSFTLRPFDYCARIFYFNVFLLLASLFVLFFFHVCLSSPNSHLINGHK